MIYDVLHLIETITFSPPVPSSPGNCESVRSDIFRISKVKVK